MTDPLPPARDWSDAFANMAHVPEAHLLPDFWAGRAQRWREALLAAGGGMERDIAYGPHPRERFDIVWPEGPVQGLAVFVHGGYWMRLSKDHWTDLAQGVRAAGWALCLPGYVLTPEVRIGQITAQIGRAIKAAAAQVDGPICLAGHSAGGHLVTRMLCADSPLSEAVLGRVARCLSISGLHDLRPLLHTQMNETLRLDLAQARAESPVLAQPKRAIPLTCWVGGGELPEFIRQAELLATIWSGLDMPVRAHIDGTHNHFTVIEDLKTADSPIVRALLGADCA